MADPNLATLAGMPEDTLRARTGKDWGAWVAELDAVGAGALDHAAIAALIQERWPAVDAWWAQAVTVGYERLTGRRAVGQLESGTFAASKSKTFPVPVAALFQAFVDEAVRTAWMGPAQVRTATPDRSVRLTWPDGTVVSAWLTDKGEGRSAVSVQHEKLPDAERRDAEKAAWAKRLSALHDHLARR